MAMVRESGGKAVSVGFRKPDGRWRLGKGSASRWAIVTDVRTLSEPLDSVVAPKAKDEVRGGFWCCGGQQKKPPLRNGLLERPAPYTGKGGRGSVHMQPGNTNLVALKGCGDMPPNITGGNSGDWCDLRCDIVRCAVMRGDARSSLRAGVSSMRSRQHRTGRGRRVIESNGLGATICCENKLCTKEILP